jgi:GTP cyclohydrolase I
MQKKMTPNSNPEASISPAVTNFPSPLAVQKNALSDQEKIDIIASRFKDILEVLGLNLDDPSITKTPERIAKMYVQEIFSGLDPQNFPAISFFKDEFHHAHQPNMVFVKVSFTSFCEHHFVPMNGVAYVAYLPDQNLIGLSKIPRIVRFFAKRPQLQERLTAQIADSLCILLGIENVAVSIAAHHYCVIARGIEDSQSHTITNVLRGEFDTNDSLRREFFEGINRASP